MTRSLQNKNCCCVYFNVGEKIKILKDFFFKRDEMSPINIINIPKCTQILTREIAGCNLFL